MGEQKTVGKLWGLLGEKNYSDKGMPEGRPEKSYWGTERREPPAEVNYCEKGRLEPGAEKNQ